MGVNKKWNVPSQAAQTLWEFVGLEFRRGCMKINKISLKCHFSTEIDIKMTFRYLVFVFCYLMSLGL